MPPQDPANNGTETDKRQRSNGRSAFSLERGDSDNDNNGSIEYNNNNNNNDDDDDDELRLQHDERGPLLPGDACGNDSDSHSHSRQSNAGSFLARFLNMEGPPQIALLMVFLAVGFGSTMGVVPAVATDRFARLNHGYNQTMACDEYSSSGYSDSGRSYSDRDGDNSSSVGNDVTAGNGHAKPEACYLGSSDAQAAASISNLVNNLLTFSTASLMGAISDEYGRKGPLLVGIGMAMAPSLCLYLLLYAPTLSPWWYYGTSAAGGLVSWMAIALSALNDVLPQELRAPGTGLLFAGMLLGISVSPTLSLLLHRTTLCLVSFATLAAGFLVCLLLVPETLPTATQRHAQQRRRAMERSENDRDQARLDGASASSSSASPLSELRRVYYGTQPCRAIRRVVKRPLNELSIVNRNGFFRLLSALALFTGMVQSGDQVLLIYYLENQLDFRQADVGTLFLIIGVCGIGVQVLVMKPLNDAVGEKTVVVLSFLAGALDNVVYGLAKSKAAVFSAVAISSLATMSFPTISAIKANNVTDSEQGRIQGALYSVKALASGVGPALLQYIYSKTSGDGNANGNNNDNDAKWYGGPGTMFLFAGGLFLVAVGLALALPNDKTNTSRKHGGSGVGDAHGDAESDNANIDNNNDNEQQQPDEYRRLAADSGSEEEYDDDDIDDEDTTYGSL